MCVFRLVLKQDGVAAPRGVTAAVLKRITFCRRGGAYRAAELCCCPTFVHSLSILCPSFVHAKNCYLKDLPHGQDAGYGRQTDTLENGQAFTKRSSRFIYRVSRYENKPIDEAKLG